MNKILFLSLALFVAETVSAEEGLQPYLFFGNSGQTIEDTNESISTALSVSGFEVLGQYSPAESPERSVFVVSHPELLDRFVRPASECRVFFCNQNWLNFC